MIIPLALWFPFLASFPFHPVKYHSAATVGPKNDKIVHYITQIEILIIRL